MIILLANSVDPDQMPHYVASDLGLHCLPIPFYGVPGKNWLKVFYLASTYATYPHKALPINC